MDTLTKEKLDGIWEISLYKMIIPLGCDSDKCVGGGGGLTFKSHTVDINDFMFC